VPQKKNGTTVTSQDSTSTDVHARFDPEEIFAAAGEVPYAWRIDTDELAWGRNVGDTLAVTDPAALCTGKGYAQLIDPKSGSSRAETVMRGTTFDRGAGVAYQVQYALRAGPDRLLWIEDTGRWFAGRDGKPLRAHGVVRTISE
jgi:hypothetical protein